MELKDLNEFINGIISGNYNASEASSSIVKLKKEILDKICSVYVELSCEHSRSIRHPSDEYGSRCCDEDFEDAIDEEQERLKDNVVALYTIAQCLLQKVTTAITMRGKG